MFSAWDVYHDLPPAEYSLDLELVHPDGTVSVPVLKWEMLPEEEIGLDDIDSLPEDLKIIYYLNKAAGPGCNPIFRLFKKRIRQGIYTFPEPLKPGTLYTALFKSVKWDVDPLVLVNTKKIAQQSEVHKYSFTTSRYADFGAQVKSFVLPDADGTEAYAIYSRKVAFTPAGIEAIKPLVNENQDDDPEKVLRYTEKFDRLVYGGLQIKDLEPVNNTTITLVINIDENERSSRSILGILIRNPEPFNDPKLPAEQLKDTVTLTLVPENPAASAGPLIYIHSRDTSAVFITNEVMNIPPGKMGFECKYMRFDGKDYTGESVSIPPVSMLPYYPV